MKKGAGIEGSVFSSAQQLTVLVCNGGNLGEHSVPYVLHRGVVPASIEHDAHHTP